MTQAENEDMNQDEHKYALKKRSNNISNNYHNNNNNNNNNNKNNKYKYQRYRSNVGQLKLIPTTVKLVKSTIADLLKRGKCRFEIGGMEYCQIVLMGEVISRKFTDSGEKKLILNDRTGSIEVTFSIEYNENICLRWITKRNSWAKIIATVQYQAPQENPFLIDAIGARFCVRGWQMEIIQNYNDITLHGLEVIHCYELSKLINAPKQSKKYEQYIKWNTLSKENKYIK